MRSLLRAGSVDDDTLFGGGVAQQPLLQCAGRLLVALQWTDGRHSRHALSAARLGAGAGAGAAAHGGTDGDVGAAVQQIAEMALLGAGCADVMFPASLDEMYEQADELVFRVAL
jgi:hypothetical protein